MTTISEAYIIDGIRTPIGNFGGSLSSVRTDDLAAMVIKEVVQRNPNVPTKAIDDVIFGCANQAGEDNRNVARMASLLAGIPVSVPGETVNRLCASGLAATVNAYHAIKSGEGHVFITGGVESMTRGPWVMSKSAKPFGNDAQLFDSSFGWRFINPKMAAMYGTEAMGETAENLVDLYHIGREEQDLFAYHSHMRAAKARDNGRFAKEILPVSLSGKKRETTLFDKDEFIKDSTTLDRLAALKPVFRKDGGTVTAGNSSGINDGAAALLIASKDAVARYNLQPLARIVASAVVGVEPRIMGIGPVGASQKALQRAGLRLNDMDIIEFNEAFAAQTLACLKALSLSPDDPRINPNGGAIALGHPLGMSGARLLLTASLELQLQQKRYALVTLCVGVGQGHTAIIERV